MKQLSLRNIFGYLTIVCIALAVLRRPILYMLSTDCSDWFHCVLVPYYWDFYLLGFESYWPFGEKDFREITGPNTSFASWCVFSLLTSFVLWLFLHIALLVSCCQLIYYYFFKEAK